MNAQTDYRESQWLLLGPLWVALAIPPVVVTALLLWQLFAQRQAKAPGISTGGLTFLACLLWIVFLRLVTVRMTTEVGAGQLRIRFKGVFVRRRVSVSEIASADAVRYNPVRDFGGYGIRSGAQGKAYIAAGIEAVRCLMRDGSFIFVGTQHPKELLSAIRAQDSGIRK